MLKYLTLLISLFVLISTKAFSQSPAPTKITVYKADSNTPTTRADSARGALRHLIKWNYGLLARGVFLINYEFPIIEKLNAEVGAGITYHDFIFEMTHSYYAENSYATQTASYALEGGLRLYPAGADDFEGFYISPMVSYRKYKSISDDQVQVNSNAYVVGYNFLDLQFKLGYQYENFWIDDLVSDVYVGIAWRNANVNIFENKSSINSIPSYEKRNQKLKFPQFMLGIKIGFPF